MKRKIWQKREESKKEKKNFMLIIIFFLRCRAISKENKQFKETVENQQRQIEAQSFVMTNLRNGIDYLKATCKNKGVRNIDKSFNI